MSSEIGEVRSVLSALIPKISECKENFMAQNIGNTLYGLQDMSSEIEEVRSVLSVLAPKIRECKERFIAQNVGNSLFGLQGMSSESEEVRSVLSALVAKISECNEPFLAQTVCNALYGLQGMSSETEEVRSVLSTLAPKIRESKENMSPQNVCNALYGLQGMNSEMEEVQSVLVAITQKIRECKEPLNKQDVDILKFILNFNFKEKDDNAVLDLFEALDQKSTENFYSALSKTHLADVNKRRQSKAEVKYQKLASKVFNSMPTVKSSFNERLFGYEADIVFRIGSAVINVEVDGIHHKNVVKKRFCGWRDRYLSQRHGIIVKRIDLMTLEERSLSDQDIIERFRSWV
jgi:uncharacterized protein YukE